MPNIEEIKAAITDREEELQKKFQTERIIVRECQSAAQPLVNLDSALIISGPRRCGKSILAYMLGRGKKTAYVNFDDERLRMESSGLNAVLEAIYSLNGDVDCLIFDEIQNVPGWELFISRLLLTKQVILTGSNARLLSKELATHLTGRHIDFILLPFSFREFLSWNGMDTFNLHSTRGKAQIKDLLAAYIETGGFPLAHKLGRVFLAETYQDVVERDVIQRYKIQHAALLRTLAKHLVSSNAKEISFNAIKNTLGAKSARTVQNYIFYICNTYLVFLLERFSFKIKMQARAPKKVYCVDTGLAQTIRFQTSEDKGRLLENVVAIELFKTTRNSPGMELYYWKDHQQHEVDFVIKEKNRVKRLVQVTYVISKADIPQRELTSLLKASEELRCNNLLVLTHDWESQETISGKRVHFVPVWKWLLEAGS